MDVKKKNQNVYKINNKVDFFRSCSHILTKTFCTNFVVLKCRRVRKGQPEYNFGSSLKFLIYLRYRLRFVQHRILSTIFDLQIISKSVCLFAKQFTIIF